MENDKSQNKKGAGTEDAKASREEKLEKAQEKENSKAAYLSGETSISDEETEKD